MLDHGVKCMPRGINEFSLVADASALSIWDASPSLMKVVASETSISLSLDSCQFPRLLYHLSAHISRRGC